MTHVTIFVHTQLNSAALVREMLTEQCVMPNRRVHALGYIMGNQGKIVKKQSGKEYVFLHISLLS